MAIARVFKSGNSQAIRLPKEFRVESRELEIYRRDDEIVLRVPEEKNIARVFELLRSLPDDFLPVREQEPPQSRDGL
jgi:antitoxin VapB